MLDECQNDIEKMRKELLANRLYGHTCIFIDDKGVGGYQTRAEGHWKPVCMQCGYLWELGKVDKLNRQLKDVSMQSGQFQQLTR